MVINLLEKRRHQSTNVKYASLVKFCHMSNIILFCSDQCETQGGGHRTSPPSRKRGELKLQPKQRSRSELLWHFALPDEVQLAKIAVVIFLSSQRVILKVPEK